MLRIVSLLQSVPYQSLMKTTLEYIVRISTRAASDAYRHTPGTSITTLLKKRYYHSTVENMGVSSFPLEIPIAGVRQRDSTLPFRPALSALAGKMAFSPLILSEREQRPGCLPKQQKRGFR